MQLAINTRIKIGAEEALGLSFMSSSEAVVMAQKDFDCSIKVHTQFSSFLCLTSLMAAAYHSFRSVQASIHWVTLCTCKVIAVRQPTFAYLRE